MKITTSILPLCDTYEAFILDLWGVIHDGRSLYPGVRETLEQLRERGKQVIMLSNAPRRASKAAEVLANFGITHEFFDHVITSGEAVYGYLDQVRDLGTRYYYMGPDKDLDILDGLDGYHRAGLAQANFILNVGFFYDFQPLSEVEGSLKTAVALNKPMICANPDRIVVRRNGEVLECAGLLAETYEAMGGKVIWFGKPYPEVYTLCLKRFVDVDASQILAVGDNLETDIQGAWGNGLKVALVAGGILRDTLLDDQNQVDPEALNTLMQASKVQPTYVLSSLSGQ